MREDFAPYADEVRRGLTDDAAAIETFQPFESRDAFAPFDPFLPLDASKLPRFPVDSLPPVLRYMAKAAAENLQVAVDMTAVAGLAVASLCVQGKFIINPKPGWIEQLNLYTAVIARPSDRKIPALSVMTRPLHAFEKEENERRAPMVEQYRTKKAILEKRIAGLKELAGNGRMHSMEEMEPGLKVLVDRGYIRIEKIKTGGRPTEKIVFNPEATVQ